ncbi:hypothetical protein Ancab_005430 [Ancistrocladus abbreviatus]
MSLVSPPLQCLVKRAMGGRWNTFGFQFICFVVLFLSTGLRSCLALNLEGMHLLKFQARVDYDPYNELTSWNPEDEGPCKWFGVHCVDGKVQMLNLTGLSLEGTLAPELGFLSDLRVLVLYRNYFSGAIPRELGQLEKLDLLDLRDNNLTGKIPAEIGRMISLKNLLLCGNKFEEGIPLELGELSLLSELHLDHSLASVSPSETECIIKKFGNRPTFETGSSMGRGDIRGGNLQSPYEPTLAHCTQNLAGVARRSLLEQSTNLQAAAAQARSSPAQVNSFPISHSSGSFPAVTNGKNQSHPDLAKPTPEAPSSHVNESSSDDQSHKIWIYVAVALGVALLLAVSAALFFICRSRRGMAIGPWKTGLSGQLQKAFVTGVPKLNRSELETACEDFSNIVDTIDGCTIYKGTLSSGVEIAVVSTSITASKDWSEKAEVDYRKKIETLSRVNHKNFVNLVGYCEEDEPFVRMMVFEYAPNGNLFEHLHVKEAEHLDWSVRMRIVMGAAYCLQYMHELNPPVAHSNLNSTLIYLTDDYAAKIAEVCFSKEAKAKISDDEDKEKHDESLLLAEPESNAYSFGVLLLEIISGRLPYSEEQGSLVNWAAEYMNDKQRLNSIVDPILKCVRNNELEVVCEVVQECTKVDPKQRPTMREITSKLREVISIAPDAAVPRLSPLWWAELEILSVEAA